MKNIILKDYSLENITFKKPEKITDKTTVFKIKYEKKK